MRVILVFLMVLVTPLYGVTRQTVSFSPGFNIVEFATATDNAGNAYAAFTVFIETTQRTVLQAAVKPAGQPWILPGDPRFQENTLSDIFFNVQSFKIISDQVCSSDQAGNVLIVWRINNFLTPALPSNIVIQCSYKPAGSTSFPRQGDPRFQENIISPIGFTISDLPNVDMRRGFAIIAWEVFNGMDMVAQALFKTNTATKFTIPQNSQNFSPVFQENCVSLHGFSLSNPPQVSVDLMGNSVVAWRIFNQPTNQPLDPASNHVIQATKKPVNQPSFDIPGDPRLQENVVSPILANALSTPEEELTIPTTFIENDRVFLAWRSFGGAVNGPNTVLQVATIP